MPSERLIEMQKEYEENVKEYNLRNKYIADKRTGIATIITQATTKYSKALTTDPKTGKIIGEVTFSHSQEPIIDYDETLINYLGQYRITSDIEGLGDGARSGYFKINLRGNDGVKYLHRVIYEYISKTKLEDGYEIDHFNSNILDHTSRNLVKLSQELHDIKLKAINQFYIPYTINLTKHDVDDKFLVVLCDLGFRTKQNEDSIEATSIYENNCIVVLEYDNINNLIFDLDLFKKGTWNYEENKKIIEMIEYQLNRYKEYDCGIDDTSLKIRHRSEINKANKIKKLKFTKEKFDEIFNIYCTHMKLTEGNSQGTFNNINNVLLDFNIFNKNEEELKEIGLVVSER